MSTEYQTFMLDRKSVERQKNQLAISIKVKFKNCRRGAAIRFVRWCKASHPDDKISASLVSRIIAKNPQKREGISLEKIYLVHNRMAQFFSNIEKELSLINHLVAPGELDKARLYKGN